jgi:hypothetical protein
MGTFAMASGGRLGDDGCFAWSSLDDHEPLKLLKISGSFCQNEFLKTSGSFRQDELKLLDYAVMKSDWSAGKKKWPSLCAKIAKQKWIRNAAAHSSLGFRKSLKEFADIRKAHKDIDAESDDPEAVPFVVCRYAGMVARPVEQVL